MKATAKAKPASTILTIQRVKWRVTTKGIRYVQGSTGKGWWQVDIHKDGQMIIDGPAAAQLRMVLGKRRTMKSTSHLLALMGAFQW